MYEIRHTPQFEAWLHGLKDPATRARLLRRLERAARGNLGDTRPVGEGVHEMREHFGPGWRMYYVLRGRTLIVMLVGGQSPRSVGTSPAPWPWPDPWRADRAQEAVHL